MFLERGYYPLAGAEKDAKKIQAAYYAHMFPAVDNQHVADLLSERKYIILQGPPGTGKTRMALELLRNTYEGNGQVIQFHPNTTYENFVGGLAPVHTEEGLGLQFKPKPGFLMEAAAAADAGGQVGALPTSGRPDYGLVIKPRFGWQGIGLMLGSMGWKVIPIPLRLPLLPRPDRKIPPWVLSTTILLRLQKLLEQELNRESWAGLEKELREQHREDLLQVLVISDLHLVK
ncbi:MAG: AAA family ATPase [Dethiobacteria bacterium]